MDTAYKRQQPNQERKEMKRTEQNGLNIGAAVHWRNDCLNIENDDYFSLFAFHSDLFFFFNSPLPDCFFICQDKKNP